MSLNYDYIFGQIDKAKKKRKRWTQADTDAASKKLAEDKEARGPMISQRRYKRPKDRKPGEKPGTHREGTTKPFKYEKPVPKGGRATNVGTSQAAHSSGTLTNAEREEKKQQKKDRRKLTPEQIAEKKRRANVGIGDLNADGKISDEERELLRQQPRKPFDIEAKERKAREEKKRKETEAKVTEGTRSIATGLPTVRTIEHGEAEVEEKRRERQRKRGGKKPGIDPDYKKEEPEKTKKPKEDKVDEETDIGPDDGDYVVDYSDDDEDSDVGPIGKSLWKSWLKNKVSMSRHKTPPKKEKPMFGDPELEVKLPPGERRAEYYKDPKHGKDPQADKFGKIVLEKPKKQKPAPKPKPKEDPLLADEKRRAEEVERKVRTHLARQTPKPSSTAPKPKPATKKPTSASKPKPAPKKEEPAIKPKPAFTDVEREAKEESPIEGTKRKIRELEARLAASDKLDSNSPTFEADLEALDKPKKDTPAAKPNPPIDEEDDFETAMKSKSLWKSWLVKREVRISDLPQGGSGKVEEVIDAQRHGAISGAKKRKRRKAKELLEGIEGLEKDDDKNDKEKEDNNKEKEVKSILEDAKRYGTGNPRASDMYKSWLEEKLKAEEGMGGMNMGAQRGLGHEAGYKQGPGQSVQITEVKIIEVKDEEKKKGDIEKDGKNVHGYPHGKCVRCGHYMESEEYQTAEPSFHNPKEGEKVCNDCFDQEQGEFEAENFGGKENKVFGMQSDSTISHIDPKKKKSAYENHEQDESPETEPNKQQIPPSKPKMDTFKSLYKKALIIKYKNIYKPLNT